MEGKDEKGRPVVNGWHLELSHVKMDSDHHIKKAMVRGTRYGRNGGSFAQWVKGLDYRPLWVDVELRPPALGEMVLVTIHGSDIMRLRPGETLAEAVERTQKELRRVTIGFLDGEEGWTGADGWPMVVKPVAWAPLPEPWEEP